MVKTLRIFAVCAALLIVAGGGMSFARACGPEAGAVPAVEVLGHGWKRHVYSPWLETTNWYVEPVGSDVKGFQYRVVLRNVARRAVRSVEWEYRFVSPADGSLVALHRFSNNARIKPGKVRELTAFSVKPPTDILDASASRGGRPDYVEQIAIRAVVFDDGSRLTF